MARWLGLLLSGCAVLISLTSAAGPLPEEDWGDGLRVKILYRPDDCVDSAKAHDIIHYHYVGRLFDTGEEFGKSFDYNTPYIVALGKGLIIRGMDRGLVETCLWERRRITFPASLGYGDAGVGDKIPPNATLTFYIRMVKIVRQLVNFSPLVSYKNNTRGHQHLNGRSLKENSQSFTSLYQQATESYTLNEHNGAIALMESVIPLHQEYHNKSVSCLQQCQDKSVPSLSDEQNALLNRVASRMPFVQQYLKMAAVGNCVSSCKKENLGLELKVTSSVLLNEINNAKYYDYLQYSYFQVKEFDEGAKCAFSYFYKHPDDESIKGSVSFYRQQLGISSTNFTVYRESGVSAQQEHYKNGISAYKKSEWLKAIDNFEACFSLYKKDMDECRAYCEDVLFVNASEIEINLYEDQEATTEDVYTLMAKAIEPMVQCKVDCYRQLSTIDGQKHKGYLASIFSYLQYVYYTVGRLNNAAECAASYQVMEPSDSAMSKNVLFYKSQLKIPEEKFVARQDVVTLYNYHQMDQFLLGYIKSGVPPKKKGVRGDSNKSFDYHSEL